MQTSSYHRLVPLSSFLALSALMTVSSCGNVGPDDIIDDVSEPDGPGPGPAPSSCAVLLCPENTECVVLKTSPPQASCRPIPKCSIPEDPCATVRCASGTQCVVQKTHPPTAACEPVVEPKRCFSSEACPADTRCSTERGDCQSACEPGVPCIDVCAGVCEPREPDVNPCAYTLCPVNTECIVLKSYPPRASCQAIPPPARKCFGAGEGSPTSCKPLDTWKSFAASKCEAAGLTLTEIRFPQETCGDGMSAYVKYQCCSK